MKITNNNPNLKIDSMFAFVAQGEGGEGIMAASMLIDDKEMLMPLVGADINRIKSLLPVAQEVSKHSGRSFKIYRFDNKVDITEEVLNAK